VDKRVPEEVGEKPETIAEKPEIDDDVMTSDGRPAQTRGAAETAQAPSPMVVADGDATRRWNVLLERRSGTESSRRQS